MLQPRRLGRARRAARRHQPVIVGPIGPIPGHRCRRQPVIRVHRLRQQPRQPFVMRDQPRHGLPRHVAQVAIRRDHVAAVLREGKVHVQARSAPFGDRLGQEGQHQPPVQRDLSGQRAEHKGVVAGLKRFVKAQGHFELAVVIFAVHRLDPQARVFCGVPDRLHQPFGIVLRTGAIDKGARRVIGPPCAVVVLLKDIGLELQPHHGAQALRFPPRNRAFQRAARAQAKGRAVSVQIAQHQLFIRPPRRARDLGQQLHVGDAVEHARARHRDQIAVECGAEHTPGKADAALRHMRWYDLAPGQVQQVTKERARLHGVGVLMAKWSGAGS